MTIEEVLAAVGLPGHPYERDEFSDDDYPTYNVWVPRDQRLDLERKLLDVDCGNFSVHFKQLTPQLVHAEPGQLVRVYSEYHATDEESALGVVTSKREVNGITVYGCSHVQVAIGSMFNSSTYAFHVTHEAYGGYHRGFLKVIPPEELLVILTRMIENGHKSAVGKADAMRETALQQVGGFVKMICERGRVDQVTTWSPGDKTVDEYVSVDIKLPVVYVPDNKPS
jgi:hypothetical protein